MEEKLIGICAQVLNMDAQDLTMDSTYDAVDEWDSLAMVQMVSEIEGQFDCVIPFDDIEQIKKISDFAKYINE